MKNLEFNKNEIVTINLDGKVRHCKVLGSDHIVTEGLTDSRIEVIIYTKVLPQINSYPQENNEQIENLDPNKGWVSISKVQPDYPKRLLWYVDLLDNIYLGYYTDGGYGAFYPIDKKGGIEEYLRFKDAKKWKYVTYPEL